MRDLRGHSPLEVLAWILVLLVIVAIIFKVLAYL